MLIEIPGNSLSFNCKKKIQAFFGNINIVRRACQEQLLIKIRFDLALFTYLKEYMIFLNLVVFGGCSMKNESIFEHIGLFANSVLLF